MIRLGIVDDKLSNRSILKEKLKLNPLFSLVLEAGDGEEFLTFMKELQDRERPDIVLMDLEMPHLNGATAIAAASSLYPAVKFVVLTIFDDEDKIFKAIRAGACGYLLKEESGAAIMDMLMNLWESGAGPISPTIAYKILQMVQRPAQMTVSTVDDIFFHLSDREKEILQLLSQGLEYKEIGNLIHISSHTVKKHCISIYQKLHVNSRAQALRIAYTRGLI
ncbi:MAG TPA: response regulator transcription factor [Lacibacter sp.]|nr:response regulator transcription factor [Lacibacter sp.]HMO88175.1 response regulator transcription factor [Lacibacter sp.]